MGHRAHRGRVHPRSRRRRLGLSGLPRPACGTHHRPQLPPQLLPARDAGRHGRWQHQTQRGEGRRPGQGSRRDHRRDQGLQGLRRDHRSRGRGWVDAAELTPGSRLSNSSGRAPTVTAAERTQAVRTVFNLTVAGTHTYFVVADGRSALVHNCSRNSSKWFSSKRKAYQQRRKDHERLRRQGYSCELRGPCSNGGHAHLTWSDGEPSTTVGTAGPGPHGVR
ncbi:polymorphic toxin-type HINT domain-containing protein [Streptomyces sp. NPDC096351]|uniref:polymorphic toxin-type HINT domain-containing protein n=1 Tax=Streptomyces sp. NPDC096351 TaxID=3366087 RepID=UPI0038156927